MILPGFPVLLPAAGGKAPFSFSGSWETGDEGWTRGSGMLRAIGDELSARTGESYFRNNSATNPHADYVISAAIAGGMAITASVYAGARGPDGGNVTRSLQYKIGAGSFITLDDVTDNLSSYTLLTGSFNNPGEDDITIRVLSGYPGDGQLAKFDDWEISGVAL